MTRLVLCLLLLAPSLLAHDLYLVVEGEGAKRKVCARIGEHFPESMNAVPVNRIGIFRAHRDLKKKRDLAPQVEEKQTCAALPGGAGGAVSSFDDLLVEMTVNPNFIRLSAKDFNSYIEGEGFKAVIAERKMNGKSETEGRELYSRSSKLVLPNAGDQMFEPIGHALEIIPAISPDKLKPGSSLPVTVFFRGQPLAGVRISAVYAGAKLEGHTYPVTAETDGQGRAELKIDRGGWWYVRLIHMVPSGGDPDYDWRSFFATLTFEVPAK